MPTPIQQPSFVGGELAPTLSGRVDIDRYKQSLALCENFIVDPHGGVKNRQGTEYFGKTKLQDGTTVRLITFAPSADESYILEFGHFYLRIFDKDGPVYSPGHVNLKQHNKYPIQAEQELTQGGGGLHALSVSQSFVGSSTGSFTIGKIGLETRRSPGSFYMDLRVAIFTNSGGLPGTAVPGLNFSDFTSVADLPDDIPIAPAQANWRYFELKDPAAGAPPFASGTVLHLVVSSDPVVPGAGTHRISRTLDSSFSGGTASYYPVGGPWTAHPSSYDYHFAVFDNTAAGLIDIETPWSSATQDDLGTESQISRLVVTQSVDVMTIVDGTKTNVAYQLKRHPGNAWTLDTVQKFVSAGEPFSVALATGPGFPALAPTRKWQYVVSGIDINGKEGLPVPSAVFDVGSNISTTLPVVLSITVGDEIMDHYAVYKGIDGTYGFIGTVKTPRTVTELANAAYWDAYYQYIVDFIVAHGGRIDNSLVSAMYSGAAAAGQAASTAAATAGGVIPNVTKVNFADENIAPDYTDPPRDGANPFTEDGGYKPACVAHFQQRLVFANVVGRPDTIFMSEVSDYDSFQRSIPTVDDDSIEATLAQGQLNEIRFLVPMRDLLVLTTGAEHVLTGGGKPVTPSNLDAAPVSHRGCGTLHPLVIGNVILFKDIGGHVREWLYEQSSNDYPATDVGLLANHLFTGYKVTEWAYVSSPTSVVSAIRSDGTMLSFTYVREQNVAAWARHSTQGKFRSVTSARNVDSEGESLYVVVQRTVGAVDTWFIERVEPRTDDSPFCDCSVTVELDNQSLNGDAAGEPNWTFKLGTGSGWSINSLTELIEGATAEIEIPKFVLDGSVLPTPTYPDFLGDEKLWVVLYDEDGLRYTMQILKVWPGVGNEDIYQVKLNADIPAALAAAPAGSHWETGAKRFVGYDHLIGETVAVRADDGAHEPLVVSGDGSITLNLIANRCVAGLPFESTIRTLALSSEREDIKTKQKLISSVGVDIVESKGIWVGESLDEMTQQRTGLQDPTAGETGRVEIRCANRWGRSGQVYVQNRDPVPCTIVGISPEVTLGG